MWYALFAFGGLLALAAVAGLIVSRVVRSKNAKEALPPAQKAWLDAERAYQMRVKQADGQRSSVAKNQDKTVKQAEKALAAARAEGTKPLDALGSALRLYQNRLETPQGTISFESGPVTATVDVSGSIVQGAKGPVDNRNCFVTVVGGGITAAVQWSPAQEAKARTFAAATQNASVAWPTVRDAAAAGVAAAERALREAQSHAAAAMAEAEGAYGAVAGDTAALDAARADASVKFCSQCNRNVPAEPNGFCPRGHDPGSLSDARAGSGFSAPATRVGFGKPDMIAAAGLILGMLMMCGGVAGAPTPEATTAGNVKTGNVTQPGEKEEPAVVSPVIDVVNPAAGTLESQEVTLTCTVTPDGAKLEWSLDGVAWSPMAQAGGSWEAGIRLALGANVLQVRATTLEGLTTTETVSVTYEPRITLNVTAPPASVEKAVWNLKGSVSPACDLTVNGKKYSPKADGSFAIDVPLVLGANTISVQATKALYKSASQSFELERTESAAEYKASCEKIKYSILAKNPDAYLGQRAYFKGKIFMIKEDALGGQAQIWVTKGSYDIWDDPLVVIYDGSIPFGEDDIIQVWGEIAGTMTGTNAFGGTISQPGILAKYITK